MTASGAAARNVVLIGAGRHGHNLIGLLEDAGLSITVVLDDNASGAILGYPVASLADYDGPVWDAHIAIGNPDARRALVERLLPERFRWPAFVDGRAVVSRHAVLAAGVFVGPLSTLADVRLEPHVSVFTQCVLGSQVRVGAFTTIAPHVTVASDAYIGEACMLGMGSRIEAGVTIGDGCQIGPNALVRRDLPPGSLVVLGSRARITRRRVSGSA